MRWREIKSQNDSAVPSDIFTLLFISKLMIDSLLFLTYFEVYSMLASRNVPKYVPCFVMAYGQIEKNNGA